MSQKPIAAGKTEKINTAANAMPLKASKPKSGAESEGGKGHSFNGSKPKNTAPSPRPSRERRQMAEAYGVSAFKGGFSTASVVLAAVLGAYFLGQGQFTEGFLAVVLGLLAYSATHEQRPYVV